MTEHTCKKRKGSKIDWGYKVDKHDPGLLVPIPDDLDVLHHAFERYLRITENLTRTPPYGQGVAPFSEWVSANASKPISSATFARHVKKYKADKKKSKKTA